MPFTSPLLSTHILSIFMHLASDEHATFPRPKNNTTCQCLSAARAQPTSDLIESKWVFPGAVTNAWNSTQFLIPENSRFLGVSVKLLRNWDGNLSCCLSFCLSWSWNPLFYLLTSSPRAQQPLSLTLNSPDPKSGSPGPKFSMEPYWAWKELEQLIHNLDHFSSPWERQF